MPFDAESHAPVPPPAANRPRRSRGRLAALAAMVAASALALPAAMALPASAAPDPTPTDTDTTTTTRTITTRTATPAADDDFYQPPADLPEGEDGEIIKWEEQGYELSARNFLVMYHSTNATGQDIPVTGRVFVPKAKWRGEGPRPIVSLASGTRGVGDSCAPSRWLDYERPFIEPMLLAGWAVAVTDYEGLGTPGMHTYVVGQSEGRTVIDAARAATNLPETGLEAGGKVAFSGYSQGGGGAMWAGELQPDYAPELDLVGVAAGGVPADLDAVADGLDGKVGFGFLLMAAYGLDAAYPELDLDGFLNERGRETYEREKDSCVDAVAGHAFQNIGMFTTTSPLPTPAWQARVAENRLGANPPDVPIFLFHGTLDEIVAPGQARTLRNEYCAAGADVRWEWHIGEHVSTMVTGAPSVLNFLDRRFKDRSFTDNC